MSHPKMPISLKISEKNLIQNLKKQREKVLKIFTVLEDCI